MSIAWERCCLTELLAIPQVVELSVLIRVGPCVWPNSSRVVLSKIPACFAIFEQGGIFGFGCGGYDDFEDTWGVKDCSIVDICSRWGIG
jgi:hypothetical protein